MLTNEKGISFVSVMMAIGLAGVFAVIFMNLKKQQEKALPDDELASVYAQLVHAINQKALCAPTFVGLQKGDTFNEFRYTFDANQEPFAEVGKPFRSSQIILGGMKLLTNAEVTSRNLTPQGKSPQGFTNVVLEVILEMPEDTPGTKTVKKLFDVPVGMGTGEIVKMPDPISVSDRCSTISGGDGCIADFDTGICFSDPQDAMIDAGAYWFGYCFDPTPPNASEDIILRCTVPN